MRIFANEFLLQELRYCDLVVAETEEEATKALDELAEGEPQSLDPDNYRKVREVSIADLRRQEESLLHELKSTQEDLESLQEFMRTTLKDHPKLEHQESKLEEFTRRVHEGEDRLRAERGW